MLTDYFDFTEKAYIKSKSDIQEITDQIKYQPVGYCEIYDKKSKKLLLKGFNKIMLSASEFMALRMFKYLDFEYYTTPTYNSHMELDVTVPAPQLENVDPRENSIIMKSLSPDYTVCLFAMGVSGCPRGSQIKYEVSNKGWIKPKDLVPFQYVDFTADLDEDKRRIYFGRKTLNDKHKIAYYFKEFDSDPVYLREYEDGTNWTSEVYQDESTIRANVKVGITFSVEEEDGRDYFDATTGINDARFSTISLLAAWPQVSNDGIVYYQDIRPFTRLNFPHKYLSSAGDSYEFRYFLYF